MTSTSKRAMHIKYVATVFLIFTFTALIGTIQAAPGDQLYVHAGHLVEAGHTKLNFYCTGSGSPTVILDGGWEDWSPSWAMIQPAISRHTRTCSYDRAGSGFSDVGPMPRTTAEIAKELHAALHNARIPGPYLLVGHSFGGYTARAFADIYMPEVYGAVFVDIEDYDVSSAKERSMSYRQMNAAERSLVQCRNALANHQPLPRMSAAMLSDYTLSPDTPCSHQFFRGLPMKEWSPQLNATVLHIAGTSLPLYDAVISEVREMPADANWLIAHRRSFGSRPLRILTAQNHYYDNAKTPRTLHVKHLAFEQDHAKTQAAFLSLSTDAKQTLVLNSGHYIQLDQPQVVIDAIFEELSEHQN